MVDQGKVILTGSALTKAVQPFVATVKRMQGIEEVDNQLQVYESTPDLQSGGTPREFR